MVALARTGLDVVAAVVAAAGSVAVYAVVRCRRHETVLGRTWLALATGPFRQQVPVDLVAGTEQRPATGWRRLYGDRELVLRLTMGQEIAVPSREPEEITAALAALAPLDH